MTVKLIAENILIPDDFLSATEQEGEHVGQPVPDAANTGAFRLLSKGTIADFTYSGTCTGEVPDTTSVIDSVLAAFGDDYFIGGTVTFTGGDNNGETRAVTDFAQATGDLTCAAFTNVVNIGDTFTLTVAFASRDFRAELVASGDAGDATFKWSHDGGTTYLGRDDPNQANWLAQSNIVSAVNVKFEYFTIVQAQNDDILCAYQDDDDANDDMYIIISTDKGLTWGAAVALTAGVATYPIAMVVLKSGRILLYAWQALPSYPLFYSDDNGVTWTEVRVAIYPQTILELSNGNLIGAFSGANKIQGYISSDGGFTWSTEFDIADQANDQDFPWLVRSQDGNIICVFQTDEDGVMDDEIKCVISSDGGSTWGNSIDVMDFVANDIQYPSVLKDINGRLYCAAQETATDRIQLAYSDDNGLTWNSGAFIILVTDAGNEPRKPNLLLVDGHQIFCIYGGNLTKNITMVRRGIWEAYAANACPCAIDAEPQHLICGVEIVWHGGAGDAADDWQFEVEYDYGMVNLIEDSPSKPWRSEQDNIVCSIVIDLGANERFLADGIGFFGCNVRTLSFQMNAADAWIGPPVDETISFDLVTGIVDAIDGNAVQDTSLLANYRDHELSDYYLRMTSGADNGVTWKIKDNVGNYILLDTTAATNIAAPNTFVIFQSWIAHTFVEGLYQYIRISITAQHTAENYYQLGSIVMGRTLSLTRDWAVGYTKSHQYDIEMLRTPKAGLISIKGAERKRIFALSWPAVETTRQELTSLLDYIDGKNVCLIPDHSDLNDCYLVKHIGNLNMAHRIASRFDIMDLVFEEIL